MTILDKGFDDWDFYLYANTGLESFSNKCERL